MTGSGVGIEALGSPIGAAAIGLELVYVATDPPMKLLRRLVPPLRLGGVSLDMSVIVLFVIIWILRLIVGSLAYG